MVTSALKPLSGKGPATDDGAVVFGAEPDEFVEGFVLQAIINTIEVTAVITKPILNFIKVVPLFNQ